MELRLSGDLKAAVEAAAAEKGMKAGEWARSAFRAALHSQRSDRPADSRARASGVGVTAQQCGLIMGTDTFDPVCVLSKGHRGPCRPSGAVSQNRITADVGEAVTLGHTGGAVGHSSSPRARRADVGPKPLSATKPRPKAGSKPKGGKGA